VFAVAIATFVAAALRFRGRGTTPTKGGGWRELSGPDLS
jgi:hypothetical protein